MKYTFKEKQKHFSELRNPEAAPSDLELLRQVKADHPSLAQYSLNPRRSADDILYTLLDFVTRDEIRNNRRKAEELDPDPELIPADKNPSTETVAPELKTTDLPAATQEAVINKTQVAKNEAEEQTNGTKERTEETEEAIEEAEKRANEAEERAEEAEEAKEEAEERAEEAEAALEQEKKKVAPTPKPKVEKPKNKTSTRKSTGTTSSTRKSKQPLSSTTTE